MRTLYRGAIGLVTVGGLGFGLGYNIAHTPSKFETPKTCRTVETAASTIVQSTVVVETCVQQPDATSITPLQTEILLTALGMVIGVSIGIAATAESINSILGGSSPRNPQQRDSQGPDPEA